jgi:serine protease
MEYAFYEGTSMAAPHVSGVAALMKSLYPDLSPAEFDTLLQAGYLTRDLGETGWDEHFGWGLIDAYKAVLTAREGNVNGGIPSILSASPGHLNFGADPSWAAPSTADVTLLNGNGGGGDLSVTDVYVSDAWLSVLASLDVDDAGLGTYRITATRSGLSDGLYTGTVTFESTVNKVSVPVVMLVGTLAETTGGYHYILLLDPETSDSITQVGTAGTDGVYEYSFSNLPEGKTYTIYAGTDPDNDFFICGEGEACGAYISLDEPVVLTVEGDMENIDFTTNINMSLPGNAAGQVAAQGTPLQRHWMREILE